MKALISALLGALACGAAASSVAGSPVPQEPVFSTSTYEVSNWRTEALTNVHITEAEIAARGSRCMKLNNYWCLKGVGANGTVGWDGGLGVDDDGHAAFRSAVHGARAAARNLRTAYTKRGRKTAWDIMSVYAPPNDCVGGERNRRPNGTCRHGKNPTATYAAQVARGITDDIRADLRLFTPEGAATENLHVLLANIAAFEIGRLRVRDETIRTGICMEAGTCPP
jgi:hypothetical protein